MNKDQPILGAIFNEKTRGYTVLLSVPIEHNGKKVEQLEIRRFKVNDVLDAQRMPGTSADQEFALFAKLCNVEPSVIAELDFADYSALQEVYRDFLGSRQSMFGKPASLSPATPDGAAAKSE